MTKKKAKRKQTAAAAPHRLPARRTVRVGTEEIPVEINDAESPLGWLRRRKGADGKPLIGAAQFEAGERLRADFTLGQMSPRVTADWSGVPAGGGRRRLMRDPAEVADHALAARERVARALEAAGPGLSGILFRVCCHLEGLEEAERGFGWPKRSGKLVLQIALDRLVRHYGIREDQAGAASAAAFASDWMRATIE